MPGGAWLQRTIFRAALAGYAVVAGSVWADTGCIISATSVNFGSYDVFSLPSVPNDSGVGSVSVGCASGGGKIFPVTLSPGQSGSYAARTMNNGLSLLTYNLYTDSARTIVWGDGSGGSSSMEIPKKSTRKFTVYGRIPGGQDAAVGIYTDLIVATVIF